MTTRSLKILVPTAGSTAAGEAADYIMEVAKAINAEIVVLQIVRPGLNSESGELTLEVFSESASRSGLTIETALRAGPVIDVVVDFAEENDIDLILMGASQGVIVDQWISSDVSRQTAIPVLVIPYQVFATRDQ